MLYSLLDYIHYVKRSGRYGENQNDGGMAVAYLGGVPSEVVAELWSGDILFTQRLDSFLSWGMMYFSSSPVDHCAIYIGEGKIFHMTLAGAKTHRIGVLGKNTRVLPVRLAPPAISEMMGQATNDAATNDASDSPKRRLSHRLPARWQIIWVGVRIMLGLHPERYRWKFLADIVITSAILDLMIFSLFGNLIFLPITGLFALFGSVNLATASVRKRRGRPTDPLSHPDIGYRLFFQHGGLMFTKIGPLVVSDIGLLPLQVFRALGRKRADHCANDQLQSLSEDVHNIIERWNAPYALYEPENEKRNQDDNEEV